MTAIPELASKVRAGLAEGASDDEREAAILVLLELAGRAHTAEVALAEINQPKVNTRDYSTVN